MDITLCCVCWDRLEYTKIAIQSVLNQTYENFKLVIVDNGSQDGTPEYLKTLTDPRIEVILWDENKGLSEATEFAFSRAKTKYLGRVDNDVCLPEDWLERCLKAHEGYDKFGFIGGFHFFLYHLRKIKDDYGETPVISKFGNTEIWQKRYIGGACFVIPKKLHDELGQIGGKGVWGLTEYQEEADKRGYVNGYLYPFLWTDHFEHKNSLRNICNEKYDVFSLRVRNVGVQDYSDSFDRDSIHYLRINTCIQPST